VYTRPKPDAGQPAAAVVSPDQATLDDAKHKCAAGDCETAHDELAGIPADSPIRSSPDFKDVENRWADQELVKGDAEVDPAKKRRFYQRVAQDLAVDAARRKTAADKLQSLDAVAVIPTTALSQLPQIPPAPQTSDVSDTNPKPDATKRPLTLADPAMPPTAATAVTAATLPPTPPATTVATAPTKVGGTADDRERQAALQATTTDAKLANKQALEQKVYSGRASDTEIRLLIATCKELGDKLCVTQARSIQQQRAQQ
jgi:hypothetical protein